MLDVKLLRQDLDAVVANLGRRGFKLDRERWLALESQRKELQVEVEGLRQTRNERSKNIGRAKAAGADVDALKREVGELGGALAAGEAKLAAGPPPPHQPPPGRPDLPPHARPRR